MYRALHTPDPPDSEGGRPRGPPYTRALLGAIPLPDGTGTLPATPEEDVDYPLEPVLH